jgi:hypothetical protein
MIQKSGKKFSEISCQDCVGRTECFDEASAFQYNPEVKCQNIWWKHSISEMWMSQSDIQPTLFYCFDVKEIVHQDLVCPKQRIVLSNQAFYHHVLELLQVFFETDQIFDFAGGFYIFTDCHSC